MNAGSIAMDEEQAELLASVENLTERVLSDKHETLCGREFSREAWRLLGGELGLLAVALPDALGGMDASHHAHAILMEAFGRHLVCQPYLSSVVAASQLLDAAKPEHTPLLLLAGRGEAIIVPALSDGPGDHGLSGKALIAAVAGDGFVLNGAKALVRDAALADHFVVLARTPGEDGGEHVLLLVPAGATGLTREDVSLIDQATASHLRFDGVHVVSSALVASGAEALHRACSAVDAAVVGVCAEAVGVMKAMHEQTLEFARQRVQFGRPIAEFQVLQHRMVDMLVTIEQAESITRLARNKLGGADATLAASACMALVAKVCRSVAQDAIQIHGAIGIANETPISRYFRRGLAIEKQFGGRNYHLMRYSQESAQRRTLAAPASA
jgi:alkylation response protein AidB-like acyl-CoA dehydrogenase